MCEGERKGEERIGEMGRQGDREDAQYCMVSSWFRMMSFQPNSSADNCQTSRSKQMV